MEPHNLIIQSLAETGVLVTFIVIILLMSFIYDCRKKEYFPVVLFWVLAGFAVTDFYANTFTTVCFMLVALMEDYDKNEYFLLIGSESVEKNKHSS